MKSERPLIELQLEYISETAEAFLVTDGDVEAWLPKSQLDWDNDITPRKGMVIDIEMPTWLAEAKGLL